MGGFSMNCSLRLFTAASCAAWMLSGPVATLRAETPASQSEAKKDVVDTAVGAKDFKTLVTAVKAADLVDVLKGKGPFTVFAPNDKAFKKVPPEQLEALLKDKKMLNAVLTYHVVPGKVMAADVVKLKTAKTVQGKPVTIAVKEGKVRINNATVVKADIECANGVIHVIDSVLMPPTSDN
jgi:transforming growth factor-beta-induced protein